MPYLDDDCTVACSGSSASGASDRSLGRIVIEEGLTAAVFEKTDDERESVVESVDDDDGTSVEPASAFAEFRGIVHRGGNLPCLGDSALARCRCYTSMAEMMPSSVALRCAFGGHGAFSYTINDDVSRVRKALFGQDGTGWCLPDRGSANRVRLYHPKTDDRRNTASGDSRVRVP